MLVDLNETRARQAADAVTAVLSRHLDQALKVVLARAKGPKARRGTKWWTPTPGRPALEVKALDPTYVVPDKLTDGLAEDMRPVLTTVAERSARDTAHRLGDTDDVDILDDEEIARAVDEAVRVILGVVGRHVREVRGAVADADVGAVDLDEVLTRIERAHRRGGGWVLMAGSTLANALVNATAYGEALRRGCTHAQWVSRRDDRVRSTHVAADGQVRRMGDRFGVGGFRLLHPGDPTDLPDSWPVVGGCRCGLVFQRPDQATRDLLDHLGRAATDPSVDAPARRALATAAQAAAALPDGPTLTPTPQGYAAPLIALPMPLVAFRLFTAPAELVPGRRLVLPEPLVLGLDAPAPPEEGGAPGALVTGTLVAGSIASLVVLVPAGVAVAYTGDAIVLPAGAVLDVVATAAGQVRARLVVEPAF